MTLTQTAILAKQIITLTSIALVLGIVSFTGYKLWLSYYLSTLPPVEERPDNKFGLLPDPDFPKSLVSSSNFTYSLDTKTGGLPKIGDAGFEKIVKVYFIVKSFATLLSPEKSQTLSERFDLNITPIILSETRYKFERQEKSLLVDLDTGNFSYLKQASISATLGVNDDNQLVSDFKRFLDASGYLKEDLREGRTKVVLLKNDQGQLSPTTLRSEAVGAQISLWPKPIDSKSIFTADFNKALVSATVLNSAANLEDYLSMEFTYYPIDLTTFATYYLKSADEAFEDLKQGRGAVILEPKKPQVSISSLYLGYYLPQSYTPFLQPIYVFEGPDFVAYV